MTKKQRKYNGEKIVFSTNDAGTTGNPHAKKRKKNLDTDLTYFTKNNSKWIIDLKVKCNTIELLEDNIGENLNDLGYGDDFFDTTRKAQSMKGIIDKLNFIKI